MASKAKKGAENTKLQQQMKTYHEQMVQENKARLERNKAAADIGRCEYCSIRTDQLPENSKMFLCSGCTHI